MLASPQLIPRRAVADDLGAAVSGPPGPGLSSRSADQACGPLVPFLNRTNRELGRGESLQEAATCFLSRWAGYWGVNQMAWVAIDTARSSRVVGISGTATLDRSSPSAEVLREATLALLDRPVPRAHWTLAPLPRPKYLPHAATGEASVGATIEHRLQSVAREFSSDAVLALPVRDRDRTVAWFFLLGNPEITTPEWMEAEAVAWESLSSQVVLAELAHRTIWSRLTAKPRRWLRRWQRWLGVGCLTLVGLAAWPAPYTMHCDCELITTDRRYAVAPYQGVLKEVWVRPGDQVVAGDLLASMDERELRIELAGKTSAHERELNQIRLARAAGDTSQARIAELEAARIAHELALLEGQLANREIRAPIPGTVVQGDLVELKGAPVDLGQNLFEIAALSELIVQIEIPEYQYRYAAVGQPVRVQLEAFPHLDVPGSIEKLLPRAFPRDQRNVFLAEVRITNPENLLRPGMKGQAKVVGDPYPWAWKWLHYPYERSRTLLGWY